MLLTGFLLALVGGMVLESVDTCIVRASNEAAEGRFASLTSVGLASAGAAATLFAGQRLGYLEAVPVFMPAAATVLGAIVFAAGAALNGACAIGTLTRLARGDLSYTATLAGGIAVSAVVPETVTPIMTETKVAVAALWFAPYLVAIAVGTMVGGRSLMLRRIALLILFGGLMCVLGGTHSDWFWINIVRRVGSGMEIGLAAACGLGLLLAGALAMAAWSGRLHRPRLDGRRFAFEAAGGALMVVGSALIPGGNDSLVALGVPSGSPHALVAMTVMLLALIAIAVLRRRLVPIAPSAALP